MDENTTIPPEDSGPVKENDPGTDQSAPEAETPACQGPEETIASLEARLAEANDQYLRKAADFENFRKRMNREKQEAIDFANQALLLELIPIIDDFERAIKSAETVGSTSQDFKNLYEGIAMIEKRLVSQLENKWGLKRFDSAGESFDPNRHEAIMVEKSVEITEPIVREDFIKGYTLKDRIVRSAKVKVLMPENPAQEAPGDETAETGTGAGPGAGTDPAADKGPENPAGCGEGCSRG
ncbi:MAG: nucleotide exchange factor GrpE [Spirochaetaceae bacterium]|jgi:molecular chaperone GrpE|nr:nucleotide exchange factor GrpE [Spirochaetaceae bacterium]